MDEPAARSNRVVRFAALGCTLAAMGLFVYTSPSPPERTDVRVRAQPFAEEATVAALAARSSGAESPAGTAQAGRRSSGDGPRVITVQAGGSGGATSGNAGGGSRRPASPANGERRPGDPAPSPDPGSRFLSCDSFKWQQDAQAAYVADLDDPHGLDGAPGPANDDGLACTLLPADPARPASAPALPGRDPTCSDFTWQQDAQAVYVANLDDPYGLDGPPGPENDDGIACSLLPSDPARAASVPVLPEPPPPPPPPPFPTAPPVADLVNPSTVYFGVSTPEAPYDPAWKDYRIFVQSAGKVPNLLMFFQGWDLPFPRDEMVEVWRRGALPMLTWEPRETEQPMGPDSDNTSSPGNTLRSIIDGAHDEYIDEFARATAELQLPIAIRFAHEMNGNWFPWSEEKNTNQRGEYVLAWRHVVDRFRAAGADNVIWVWSPNVITGRPSVRLAPLYPGDDYVDWVGIVGYYRRVIQGKEPSFTNTYQSTLDELATFTSKPIVLTEVGATEIGGNKDEWMASFFATLPQHPNIVGFIWFDHSVNGNDWRIESSPRATEIFREGIADPRYGSGLSP